MTNTKKVITKMVSHTQKEMNVHNKLEKENVLKYAYRTILKENIFIILLLFTFYGEKSNKRYSVYKVFDDFASASMFVFQLCPKCH